MGGENKLTAFRDGVPVLARTLLALDGADAYIEALRRCGVEVTVLDALPEFPDSCFVEDISGPSM